MRRVNTGHPTTIALGTTHACRSWLPAGGLAATLLVGSTAWGADPRALAREAYNRGTEAFGRGDFAAAAAAFRDADDTLPSPVALRAALDAAVKADDPLIGSELLERVHTRPADPQLSASARAAEAKLGHRVGRLHVTCSKACEAELDGVAIGPGVLTAAGVSKRALPGSHTVLFRIDGRSASVAATVVADAIVEVTPPDALLHAPVLPPPVTPPPVAPPSVAPPSVAPPSVAPPSVAPPPLTESPTPSEGISRAWFWTGTAVTAAAGVTGAVLLHHASTDRSSLSSHKCGAGSTTSFCQSTSSDEHTFTIAGGVTLGVAGAAGIFTLISGVWLVHWKDSGVSATVTPTAAVASWSCSF